MFGRGTAEDRTDPVIDHLIGLVILAEHFEIDAQRCPAHAEIGLPLQLHIAACHRNGNVASILVGEGHCAVLGVDFLHGHVKHPPRDRRDGQDGGIRRLPFRTERGQHDVHDVVIAFERPQQHGVELARLVVVGGAGKFVIEAEGIEETAQHGVVVFAKARKFIGPGIWHRCQGHLEIGLQRLFGRHVVGDLAHPVHVVGKADQPRLDRIAGQQPECCAHHRCAHHLSKRADMGLARGAVTGLENDLVLAQFLGAPHDLFGFLERPGAGVGGSGNG